MTASPIKDKKKLKDEIKDLISQKKVAFLIGAGCSKCVGLPLMEELNEQVEKELSKPNKALLLKIKENFEDGSTIEDYMSEIDSQINILKMRREDKRKINVNGEEFSIDQLEKSLKEIKQRIANIIKDKKIDLKEHRRFIRSLFSLRRNREKAIIDFFVLNYDTLIEDALALEKIKSCDGFNGGATAYWDIETFDDKSLRSRVFKIHGSIDWSVLDDDLTTPFRLREKLKSTEEKNNLLIYPMTSKYKEVQKSPYSQMIQKFRNLKESKDMVLVSIGYSFRDHHINEEIKNILKESDKSFTLIIFIKEFEKDNFLNEIKKNKQVKIYTQDRYFNEGKEFKLKKDTKDTEDTKLWKFEELTTLLGDTNEPTE